jgi:hypothetical protein
MDEGSEVSARFKWLSLPYKVSSGDPAKHNLD